MVNIFPQWGPFLTWTDHHISGFLLSPALSKHFGLSDVSELRKIDVYHEVRYASFSDSGWFATRFWFSASVQELNGFGWDLGRVFNNRFEVSEVKYDMPYTTRATYAAKAASFP